MADYDYMRIAWRARHNARCVKKLGTILVSSCGDHVAGWNGVPDDVPLCVDRYGKCPRQHSLSGEDLKLCPSIHAEIWPILKFVKSGMSTVDAVLYCSFGIPCKDCMKEIIQAGIGTIVVTRLTFYDALSKELLEDFTNAGGYLRVLDVVQCPECYSLNVKEYLTVGKKVTCDDCGRIYERVDSDDYIGE